MVVHLKIGLQVVARGKVASIIEILDGSSFVVRYRSGELQKVELDEIQLLDPSINAGTDSGRISATNLDVELSHSELETAALRYETIKSWKSGELTNLQAAERINVSLPQLYKVSKSFHEDVGSLSLVRSSRGRKKGKRMLSNEMELIVRDAVYKIYKSRAASYSSVWKEVSVTCREKGLRPPCLKLVTLRTKEIFSDAERNRIKLGRDAADQKHAARPGKKELLRPLARVQMDHTLVDIILLSNDRIHVIGRPWLTVVIDLYTRVLLGYYLSLHVPSALTVACTLAHAVLPKDTFLDGVGLSKGDYPFFGVPTILHMDNASEFQSPKLKYGCQLFGIQPEYRPPGRKHYGGHVERIIGTFMTTKVHFLKGSTMSNAVARRNLQSEKEAAMTFSDFSRWFAREVIVYHSTVHSALRNARGILASPKDIWLEYFAPTGGVPFPPQVTDPHQFRLYFMPEEYRKIRPNGIEFKGVAYWDPLLTQFVGTAKVIIKYDPYNLRNIWVKVNGRFCAIGLSDLTKDAPSLEEQRASAFFRAYARPGDITDDNAITAYREKQTIETNSVKETRAERRRHIAAETYRSAYPENSEQLRPQVAAIKPDYTRSPKKFSLGE